ncbi:MAG: hypothetical protein ACYDCK_00910 [Thermoplasmatota archaeon]
MLRDDEVRVRHALDTVWKVVKENLPDFTTSLDEALAGKEGGTNP